MNLLDDSKLVERFCSGTARDRELAFEEIYRRLSSGLHQICRRMYSNSASGEDAFQETMLAIYRALPTFRSQSKLATWSYRIAVRLCLRDRKSQRCETREDLNETMLARPDLSFEELELARRMDRAVASLPPIYRTAFSLCCIEELKQSDVAEILGTSEGAVWTRLHRARRQLMESLKDVLP